MRCLNLFSPALLAIHVAAASDYHVSVNGCDEQDGSLATPFRIENNVISDSKCSGITLGKDRATGHNVWSNDPSKDGAIHYNEVIVRALEAGWSREKIGSHVWLQLRLGPALAEASTCRVSTDLLGKARVASLTYENADGSSLVIDSDYFGAPRNATHPTAGPFENPGSVNLRLQAW